MSIRMGKVLPSIISIDQTCSVIGRSISDNCHLLRNVVDYINSKPLMGAALINLDFSKAFDRVSLVLGRNSYHGYVYYIRIFHLPFYLMDLLLRLLGFIGV